MRKNFQMENFSKGYTQVPHKIGNILPLIDLTARQRRVVDLIIRLTYGCQKRWVKLKFADLQTVGIFPSAAGKVIKSLLDKKYILQNSKTREYRLNEEYLSSEVTKNVSSKLEKLRALVGKQLDKRTYQTDKQKVTEDVISALPEEEDSGYQSSNDTGLPNWKVPDSEQRDFATPKDILNKEINKTIDSSNTADNSSKKSSGQVRKVNPEYFSPMNETEYAAKSAWEQIEPENPDSFGFYLWAMKQGLPTNKFIEFSSEVKSDKKVENKGAVFNKKVRNYLGDNNEE